MINSRRRKGQSVSLHSLCLSNMNFLMVDGELIAHGSVLQWIGVLNGLVDVFLGFKLDYIANMLIL